MAKGKSKEDSLDNAFGGFKVIQGGIVPPSDKDDEIKTGDEELLEDELSDEEKQRLIEADKKLEEIANKTAKKVKGEVLEDKSDEDESDEQDEDSTKTALKEFVKVLHNKNVIDFDDSDEDFEESEDGVGTLINKTIESRINKWVEALPDEYNKFLEYVQNGGDPKNFLNVYYSKHSWNDFDLSTEEKQKLAAEESLRLTGETEEDIKDIVQEWVDNGTIEKRAKSGLSKLQKFEEIQKTQILEQQAQEAENAKKAQQKYWDDFKKEIFDKEEIKGFKLTPKLKEKLWEHYTVIDKRTGKTGYQKAIEDRDASLLFGLQSMTGFDIKQLEKQVESKVSNKFGNLLKNYQKTTKDKISSGSSEENGNENPFTGFKKV
jgi:hypothetical protein